MGNKDIARSRLADDHGITLVRENQRRHIVPFAALIIRPGKTLVYVRPDGLVADRLHGGRAAPSAMAPALIPATGKHMIFAVRPLDDLPVPITPVFHGAVFEAVLRITWENIGSAPHVCRQLTTNRCRQKVINPGLVGGRRRGA